MKAIEKALSSLDGVKSAKVGKKKSLYVVQVLENKALWPSEIEKAVPSKYSFEGVEIELAGTVAKNTDGTYEFTARASNQKYRVTANNDLKKLVGAGTTKVVLSGTLGEKDEKEGDKTVKILLVSEASAKELKEEKK